MEPATTESYEERRAREVAEQQAEGRKLAGLVRAIATELPGAWTVGDPTEESWQPERTLTRTADGAHITVSHARGKPGVLHLGAWPATALHSFAFTYGHPTRPEANVAAAKGPTKIAAEIVRRVLPALDRLVAFAVERKASSDAYESNTQGLVTRLLEAAGGRLTTTKNQARTGECMLYTHGIDGYGTFRVQGDSVTIDLGSVKGETALAFARLLATLPPEKD